MDYSFEDFVRHVKLWANKYRHVTHVPTRPYDPASSTVEIGNEADEQSEVLRIDFMLARDGCTPSQQKFRCRRFYSMIRFIGTHELAFAREGFFISDEGTKLTVPQAVLRAVHETFHGEPLKPMTAVGVDNVVALAKSYPPEWTKF